MVFIPQFFFSYDFKFGHQNKKSVIHTVVQVQIHLNNTMLFALQRWEMLKEKKLKNLGLASLLPGLFSFEMLHSLQNIPSFHLQSALTSPVILYLQSLDQPYRQ